MEKKRSFFERLTGSVDSNEEPKRSFMESVNNGRVDPKNKNQAKNPISEWIEEENEEAELAVDLYQTPTEMIIQTFVAGVRPEDLELSIARDMVTIVGRREENRRVDENNFFNKELYWGKFSRVISLPKEVEPDKVEATETHGLLTIKLQKVDREKTNNVKVKSL